MRIKLNLMHLRRDKNPAIYWLHIDTNNVLLIKQLKKKVQKVLNEWCDIELCFDDVPFLDEDDIHAINENEEIVVMIKEKNNFTESDHFNVESDISKSISIVPSNGILSTDNSKLEIINDKKKIISPEISNNSKKRVRKRTHKKKKHLLNEPDQPTENNYLDFQTESSVISSKESNETHKRFKLDNEENNQQTFDSLSMSSNEECFSVSREVFCYNSSVLDSEKKSSNTQPIWKKEKPLKTKITKVPVFIRGHNLNSKNLNQSNSYIENENNKTIEDGSSDDYDMLIVDWKNMSPVKISSISELKIHDLLQFKILSMNNSGEAAMSSVITGRLENINESILTIQVLSGIQEFMGIHDKFSVNTEEDIGTQREIEFFDLFELFKLI